MTAFFQEVSSHEKLHIHKCSLLITFALNGRPLTTALRSAPDGVASLAIPFPDIFQATRKREMKANRPFTAECRWILCRLVLMATTECKDDP